MKRRIHKHRTEVQQQIKAGDSVPHLQETTTLTIQE